jgi:periplasmic protein TonB
MDARRMRRTGVVTVIFLVQADGHIAQIRLAMGSGHASLDRAALDALHRLGRFKPIPSTLGRQSWTLRVPIRFDLQD